MYVMDKPYKCEDYLHLVDFFYNNGCQASLKMLPFEAFYGRKLLTGEIDRPSTGRVDPVWGCLNNPNPLG